MTEAASTNRQRPERGSIGNGGITGAKGGSRPAIGGGGRPASAEREGHAVSDRKAALYLSVPSGGRRGKHNVTVPDGK